MPEQMSALVKLAREIGREDRRLAILGEGNVSAKLNDAQFAIKASGACLATLSEEDVTVCDWTRVLGLLDQKNLSDEAVDQALLEARAPQAKALLDGLRTEHATGAHLIRDLEQALVGMEVGWAGGVSKFRAAVEAYAEFHWKHMRKEEEEVMPLAERYLTADDWREIDAAFAGNKDPIADLREHDFEQLFTRIVSLAPEPIGLGERWKRVNGTSA